MNRREFITLLGGAAAWPLAARAQLPERARRIGVLVSGTQADPEMQARMAAFRERLEQLGWTEGRNIRMDHRFADGNPDRYSPQARELVALQPDVLIAYSTPAATTLRRETGTIPIVFANVSDPVGSGLVASLARPDGNLTGMMLYEEGIVGKWLAMLKEIEPTLSRALLLANRRSTPFDYFLRSAQAAAPSLGIESVPSPIESGADYERVIDAFAREPNGGLVFLPDGTSILNRDRVIALAARYRLPAVYAFRFFVTAGGLMSYGTIIVEHYRQLATYVDRILRGAKPAELPVETPSKYETTLNLKTAKALGLVVPASLLVRADEVIE